ncbi:MAG: CBS domain-containing protein [Gammaproteobacteria bacterium]|nr:CBS domain-containing protein [Gammaproteobacteria bacterium]
MPDSIAHKPVADVMTPNFIACSPYTSLAEADELLKKNRIRRLPVVDRENQLLGIITVRDLLAARPPEAIYPRSQEEMVRILSSITVGAVMKKHPVGAYQTDTIGRAAELMLDHKIGGLPVIDVNNQVVGIITESDVFRAIVRQWREDNLILSGAHRT